MREREREREREGERGRKRPEGRIYIFTSYIIMSGEHPIYCHYKNNQLSTSCILPATNNESHYSN